MAETSQVREPLPSSYTVPKEHYRRIRLYSGLRAFAFGICIALCIGAIIPNGTLSDPKLSIFFGATFFGGFILAWQFSKPVLIASFALPERRLLFSIWLAFGIMTAIAYAAAGQNYIDQDIANLTIFISGTGFFLVVFLGSLKLLFNPVLGGALIQMNKEIDLRKHRKSRT